MSDRQPDVARRRHVPRRDGDELLFNQGLGANLRRCRNDAKLTQDEVAGLAGLTRGSVANIERGEQTPGLFRLLMICSALNVELTEILPAHTYGVGELAGTLNEGYASLVRKVTKKAAEGPDRRAAS